MEKTGDPLTFAPSVVSKKQLRLTVKTIFVVIKRTSRNENTNIYVRSIRMKTRYN